MPSFAAILATRKLYSGASTTTTALGRRALSRVLVARSSEKMRGRWPKTSETPTRESSALSNSAVNPASAMAGPPMPVKR